MDVSSYNRVILQYPETAKFLNDYDRAIVIAVLKEDRHGMSTKFDIKYVWQAFGDIRTWYLTGTCIGLVVPVYAISLFTPTIVNELGFTAATSQIMSVPPFVCGCVATILGTLLQFLLRQPHSTHEKLL